MRSILSILNDNPDTILIDSDKESVTYGQATSRIKAIMEILSEKNAETIAIFADNQADWIFIDFACQEKNICCIPLPLFFSDKQLQHAISAADVDLIFTDQHERIRPLLNLTGDEATLINRMHIYKITKNGDSDKPEGTEKITFTSGSTGDPKGVCLTTEQQWRVAQSLADAVDVTQSRHLCVLPLSTLLENIAGVYTPILVGGSIIFSPMKDLGFNGSAQFQLEKLLHTIEHVQPDSLVLLPQLLLALVSAAESGWKVPASLKFIAVGGGRVAPHLLRRAHQCRLPVYEGYGLSECASVVSLNSPDENRPGSVGKPLPHLNVEIKNKEIVVIEQSFLGYLNEPEGWYQTTVATGDLGHLDNEGYLYIDGRKKNILVSSYGRNINPEWLESELLCHPLIQQSVVLGDALPYCTALIYPRKTDLKDIVIEQWIDETNKRLPDYARIKAWFRLKKPLSPDDNLLTNNGKPKRLEIAKCYQTEIEQMYQHLKPLIKEQRA
ncbi:Long-chain-fatty-acid--CoA ligase [hydrothermal vent metagenome]|uniref:Long-chain-fatty-acid--CoA ligase n=1 Tax=hydrothermal vent metagenome TaxID=652676 RepID=A0A3B0ZBI9_9ZZZZ